MDLEQTLCKVGDMKGRSNQLCRWTKDVGDVG